MDENVYEVEVTPQYKNWFVKLRDSVARGRIDSRLEKVKKGNLGNHKDFTGGISELRFEFGPGYRIYYAKINNKVILLTLGGDKSSQDRDIKVAKQTLKKYKESKNDQND